MSGILFDYVRSSCAYRVRIALALKKIPYTKIPISLLQNEQRLTSYLAVNPQGLVPTWKDDQITLSQSLGILEYLEEVHPEPPLLPDNSLLRARARQLSLLISCDIHPLNNLRVKHYLRERAWNEAAIDEWCHHWLREGFESFEKLLISFHHRGPFCLDDMLSFADLCLIPQVYGALRLSFEMKAYPRIMAIYEHCQALPAFAAAAP